MPRSSTIDGIATETIVESMMIMATPRLMASTGLEGHGEIDGGLLFPGENLAVRHGVPPAVVGHPLGPGRGDVIQF